MNRTTIISFAAARFLGFSYSCIGPTEKCSNGRADFNQSNSAKDIKQQNLIKPFAAPPTQATSKSAGKSQQTVQLHMNSKNSGPADKAETGQAPTAATVTDAQGKSRDQAPILRPQKQLNYQQIR